MYFVLVAVAAVMLQMVHHLLLEIFAVQMEDLVDGLLLDIICQVLEDQEEVVVGTAI